jgi:hypothetical protein
MFEPGSAAWWAAVKRYRPDLVSAFNPWERIITPQAINQLLIDSGIGDAQITAVSGQQALRSPDDWWTVVLGSGYRWTIEQMDHEAIESVRNENLKTLGANGGKFIETNVIHAVANKPIRTR